MVTFPYERKILKWDDEPQTNKDNEDVNVIRIKSFSSYPENFK